MDTSGQLHRQMIQDLKPRPTDKLVDAELALWEQMATQIISIMGEGGFNSLYARSLFLTASVYPWLTADSADPTTDQRFAQLRRSLEQQAPEQARAANRRLLTQFADILASLIGEQLTARILRAAWRNDGSDMTDKDL